MNQTTRIADNNTNKAVLYMAMELSQSTWRLAFGDGIKIRQVTIEGKNLIRLEEEISKAKEKFKLGEQTKVMSCYEAGRDGFWIHRYLERKGIDNSVIDSSSIEVNRHARRAKTDRLDAQKLLKQLILHIRGDVKLQVGRVPEEGAEDERRVHRERERLKKERASHTNRIKSLLNLHGIKYEEKGRSRKSWKRYIEEAVDWKGELLREHLREELLRQAERVELADKQIKELEIKMEKVGQTNSEASQMVKALMKLKGIGEMSAWILVREWFGWRKFRNRREVGSAAGLVGSPYNSGDSQKEQGITKAGNKRIRALMIELGWSWIRYQPTSELTKWFIERFGQGKRSRKIGIVALARKLLIACWRYLTEGELPKGAEVKG